MGEGKPTGDDVKEEPPEVALPNVFPIEWPIETTSLEDLFNVYIKEQWNPFDIRWQELSSKDYDAEERIAMAYWWANLATFENSIAPALAKVLIHTFEYHLEDPVKKLTGAFVMDECRHDQCCKMACNALCPGFPWRYKPKSELESKALRNIKWIYYNGGRYWRGLSRAFNKYALPIFLTPFTVGEVIAGRTFAEMHRRARHPAYTQFLSHIMRDESRHYAFLRNLLHKYAPRMSVDEKRVMSRRFRDSFVLLSVHFYEPITTEFWQLPPEFMETHRKLESIAMDTDLQALALEMRRKLWKEAFERLQDEVGRYGIEVPASPEVE